MNKKWIGIFGIGLIVILAGLFVFTSLTNNDPPIVPLPTVPPTNPPEPTEAVNAFSGLIYKTDDGLFQINHSGTAEKIAECSTEILSADGTSMFSQQDGDIWQLDLTTCENKNITNSPASWEVNPQIWGEQPDFLFYGVDPEMSAGAPAIFTLSSSDQLFLDGSNGWTNSGVAPSPDGNQVALRSSAGPAIYDVSIKQLSIINLSDFGLNASEFGRIEAPSWSPDGNRLAWVVGYQGQIGHLLLDFDKQTSDILHLYTPVGRGGWPRPPVWSPDEQWLIADVWADGLNQEGLYVLASDGSEEYYAGTNYSVAVWSPDSQMVVFTSANNLQETTILSIEDGSISPFPIPSDAKLVAWPSP